MTSDLTARRLGNGIGLVQLPLPFEGLRWVNCYVFEGDDGVALLDCGVDSSLSWRMLEEGLARLDVTPADIDVLIGSHMHVDHVGMAQRVVDHSGAELVMHHDALAGIDGYNDWRMYRHTLLEIAARNGASPEDIEAIAGVGDERPSWAPAAAVPTRTVLDDEEIVLGRGRRLRVIHTPGHDQAHICLLDNVSGALFSGDHVLPRITPFIGFDPKIDALGTYLDSLARIEALDQSLTYPAHVEPLERGSLRARQIALHHERRLGAILQELRDGPMTAWAIMGAIFRPHLNAFEQRLAFSETLAHLEYLERRGEVEKTLDGAHHYYRRRSLRGAR